METWGTCVSVRRNGAECHKLAGKPARAESLLVCLDVLMKGWTVSIANAVYHAETPALCVHLTVLYVSRLQDAHASLGSHQEQHASHNYAMLVSDSCAALRTRFQTSVIATLVRNCGVH